MTTIVRCTCGQQNRYPDTTARVRCGKCHADLPRPLAMGGGVAASPWDDDSDDDSDWDDDDDSDDDGDDQ